MPRRMNSSSQILTQAIAASMLLSCFVVFPLGASCQVDQLGVGQKEGATAPISGGVSVYADAPTSLPLMKGNACRSLPEQWKGVWNGSVRLNDAPLLKETPLAGPNNQYLTGKAAKMSLKVSGDNDGLRIPEISVTDNSRRGDISPDIIFFRSGENGHLWVLPGAHIVEHGENGVGDVHIGGNVYIGDGVQIGKPWSGASADPNSINREQPLINYHNNGITFGGPTSFNGRYFRADDSLRIDRGTTVTTDRVDIGAAKMYTNGHTMDVSGSPTSGYIIKRTSDGASPGNGRGSGGANNLPNELLRDGRIAESSTVMVAPGIYDQRTLSPIQSPNGTIVGYREMVARYSALGPDKMLVQISVCDPDKNNTKGISISGYLTKAKP